MWEPVYEPGQLERCAILPRVEAGQPRAAVGEGSAAGPADSPRSSFSAWNLRPAAGFARPRSGTGRRVAELDPVNSYQAWQLATREQGGRAGEYLKCASVGRGAGRGRGLRQGAAASSSW